MLCVCKKTQVKSLFTKYLHFHIDLWCTFMKVPLCILVVDMIVNKKMQVLLSVEICIHLCYKDFYMWLNLCTVSLFLWCEQRRASVSCCIARADMVLLWTQLFLATPMSTRHECIMVLMNVHQRSMQKWIYFCMHTTFISLYKIGIKSLESHNNTINSWRLKVLVKWRDRNLLCELSL